MANLKECGEEVKRDKREKEKDREREGWIVVEITDKRTEE